MVKMFQSDGYWELILSWPECNIDFFDCWGTIKKQQDALEFTLMYIELHIEVLCVAV